MKQVIVFAGTTEGRIIGEWLAAEGVETLCCVATEYGKELMKESGIARTFNQLFFIISSLLTFFHFLLYLSKIITKDN